MPALLTRHLGPTNTRGARIKARTSERNPVTGRSETLTLPWTHTIDAHANHCVAAQALADKLGWGGQWHGTDTETGYVFVRTDLRGLEFTSKRRDA